MLHPSALCPRPPAAAGPQRRPEPAAQSGTRPRRSPGAAQAPPLAPHGDTARLRRRRALGARRHLPARGRSRARRPGLRVPARRAEAKREEEEEEEGKDEQKEGGPGRPGAPASPRPALCPRQAPLARMRDPVSSIALPAAGSAGRGAASRLHPAALRQSDKGPVPLPGPQPCRRGPLPAPSAPRPGQRPVPSPVSGAATRGGLSETALLRAGRNSGRERLRAVRAAWAARWHRGSGLGAVREAAGSEPGRLNLLTPLRLRKEVVAVWWGVRNGTVCQRQIKLIIFRF